MLHSSGTDASRTASDRRAHACEFAAHWTPLRRELMAALRKRGASSEVAEDLTQEVAERLLRRVGPFPSDEDERRWCHRVASNLLIDSYRRGTRTSGAPVPDVRDSIDVETAVLARLHLDAVARALPMLSVTEQVSLAGSSNADPRLSGGAMRRLRARRRLETLAESLLGWWLWTRSALHRGAARLSETVTAAAPIFVSAIGLTILVSIAPGGSDSDSNNVLPAEPQIDMEALEGGDDQPDATSVGDDSTDVKPDAPIPTTEATLPAVTPIVTIGVPSGEPIVIVDEPPTDDTEPEPTLCAGNTPLLGTQCVDRGDRIEVPPIG